MSPSRHAAGLYSTVRVDVEQRLPDRLEGAAVLAPEDVSRVLLVGFDYLVAGRSTRMLAEPHPDGDPDPVEAFLATHLDREGLPLSRVLVAAWRAALHLADEDPSGARRALAAVMRPRPSI